MGKTLKTATGSLKALKVDTILFSENFAVASVL